MMSPETGTAGQPRATVDWERIEREYRAGQLSVSEIGRLCGVSHTAINKRAKRDGWTRNLAKRVREEVSARLVSAEVSAETAREAVDKAAARDVQLILSHRRDIGAGQEMCRTLMGELRDASMEREAIDEAIHTNTKDDGRRRTMMLRAVSLPSRARTMMDLAGAMRTLVALERQAFNIDGSPGDHLPTARDDGISELSAAEAYRKLKDTAQAV